MLAGENGILRQAQNAKKETEEAERYEREKLNEYNNFINKAVGKESQVEEGEIVEIGSGNKDYYDADGNKAIIPEGFMIIPGLSDVEKGLVISDNPDDTEKPGEETVALGNQFVWIPLTDEKEYVRNKTFVGEELSKIAYTDKDYLPSTIQPDLDGTETDEQIGEKNEEAERKAVIDAGGFYLSRYEAGEEDGKVVSKKGIPVLTGKTQDECKSIAKDVVKTDSAKSALCSGIQWDVIMNYIEQNNLKDGTGKDFDIRTASAERHKTELNESGENISDKVFNIYDLEGNALELVAEKVDYTTEDGRNMPQIARGGGWGNFNFEASARGATENNASLFSGQIGFRFVLYVEK